MRVAQILPELNLGGVEKGTVELAKYLALNGHYPIVISNGGRLERELQEFGIKHYKLPVHKKSPLSLFLLPKLIKILKKEQIDILHARSRVPAILGYLAFRAYMKELNIMKFLSFVPSFITTAHGYYSRHIFSRIMGRGKFVICPSRTIARHMMENFSVPMEKIRIIPRGVHLNEYPFIPPSQRDWDHPIIAIIGRLTPIKGHEEFIKAFRQVLKVKPFARGWIIGSPSPGKEDYLRELEILIRRYGLENAIEFLGLRYDIPELLKKINILVQPSRVPEAFGRVIIEAQASGVVVIASDMGGYREIIEDKVTGFLVPPQDQDKLAQTVIRVIKDPKGMDQIALNARGKVEREYNLEGVHSRIIKVYEEAGRSLNILIIKFGALGDAILIIPSLRAIRKKFPKAKILLLTGEGVADVFKFCPYVDKLLIYPNLGFKYKALFGCVRKVREFAPEISIDFQNNKLSRLVAYLAGVYQRYGFLNGRFSFLLNRGRKLPDVALLPVDQQLLLLSAFGIRDVDKSLELWFDKGAEERIERILASHWLSKRQLLVGINIGSSKKWTSKRWGDRKFIELINQLGSYNFRCILTGTEVDKPKALKILKSCMNKPIDLVGKTSILELIALIKRCDLFITSDSAPLHIAAGVKTPVIALFGPTDPRRHLPPGEDVYFIWKKQKCSPCYKPKCSRGNKCMNSITVEDVLNKVKQILGDKIEGANFK